MAAPGASAAALFAKQRAKAEQDQRAAKKAEKQRADNDPAAWAATAEEGKRAQENSSEGEGADNAEGPRRECDGASGGG